MSKEKTEQILDDRIREKALEDDLMGLVLFSQRRLAESNFALAKALSESKQGND